MSTHNHTVESNPQSQVNSSSHWMRARAKTPPGRTWLKSACPIGSIYKAGPGARHRRDQRKSHQIRRDGSESNSRRFSENAFRSSCYAVMGAVGEWTYSEIKNFLAMKRASAP
jgi:hypothetical protein